MKKVLMTFSIAISLACAYAQTDFNDLVIQSQKKDIEKHLEKGIDLSQIMNDESICFSLKAKGVSIIPSLIRDLQRTKYIYGVDLITDILKMKLNRTFDSEKNEYLFADYPQFNEAYSKCNDDVKTMDILPYWWDHGRQMTPQLFAQKYADYQTAKKSGNEKDIKAKYTLLQNMGVIILPDLLEKIEAGETDLIPMFSELGKQKELKDLMRGRTKNRQKELETPEDCRIWWDANKKKYEVILNYNKRSDADCEAVIQSWKNQVESYKNNKLLSYFPDHRTPLYFEIKNEGVIFIPALIRDLQKTKYVHDDKLITDILKMDLNRTFASEKNEYLFADYPQFNEAYSKCNDDVKTMDILPYWWDHGRQMTPQLFAQKYADYQTAKKSGNEKDIKAKYTLLQNMGVIILPDLLAKIEAGETDLIPMFSELGDQKDLKTAAVCRAWWDANKKRYEVILDYKKDSNVKK